MLSKATDGQEEVVEEEEALRHHHPHVLLLWEREPAVWRRRQGELEAAAVREEEEHQSAVGGVGLAQGQGPALRWDLGNPLQQGGPAVEQQQCEQCEHQQWEAEQSELDLQLANLLHLLGQGGGEQVGGQGAAGEGEGGEQEEGAVALQVGLEAFRGRLAPFLLLLQPVSDTVCW